MLRLAVVTLAILAGVAAVSNSARAETPEERQACTDDAMNHCGEAIPDRDRVYQCLVRKVRTISPPCRKIISRSIRGKRH